MYGFDRSHAFDEPTAQLHPIASHRNDNTPWWRGRTALVVAASFLAVLVIGTVAFIALRPDPAASFADPGPSITSSATASPTPSATPSASPSPSPTPSPTPTPVRTSNPVPTAPPTVAPPAAEQPPPPPPPPPPAPGCPTYEGENAPFADVRSALASAAAKQYWQGVQLPAAYRGALVPITVPVNFVNAVAYQESGWQSAIQACDGGMGTMQLMSGTLDHINQRFGMNYSTPLDLQENTEAGVNYLQWLLMYFGLYYYGQNFDPYLEANVGPNGQKLMLIDVVVAAYNVGPAALEREDGDKFYLSIPNWNYVNAVWQFAEVACPCAAL